MPNCYICGKYIEPRASQPRRKVKTGEWVRKRFSNSKAVMAQTSYGRRIVCLRCARRLDLQDLRAELRWVAKLAFLLLLMFLLLLNR